MSSSPSQPPSTDFQASSKINEETASLVEGRLVGARVIIDQQGYQDELRNRGFGEREELGYVLKSYESLYLFYVKKLVLRNKQTLTFDSLFDTLARYENKIMTRYLIYRDLRSRGYVAKEGFGFGNDFRVYERGEYEKKPAKYVVFGMNEGTNIAAKDLVQAVEQIEKMGKEAVIAVIERRGEVIYYKASRMRFLDNKHRQHSPLQNA